MQFFCKPFGSLLFIGVLLAAGCDTRRSQPLPVSDLDRRIAEEVFETVKPHIASSEGVSRRYGKLVSLQMRTISRRPAEDIFDLHLPAVLIVDCYAQFDQFSTPLEIRVLEGTQLRIIMQPESNYEEEMERGKTRVSNRVQRDDGVWYEDDKSSLHCFVTVEISHSAFKP